MASHLSLGVLSLHISPSVGGWGDWFRQPRIVGFQPSFGGEVIAATNEISAVAALNFHAYDVISETGDRFFLIRTIVGIVPIAPGKCRVPTNHV